MGARDWWCVGLLRCDRYRYGGGGCDGGAVTDVGDVIDLVRVG